MIFHADQASLLAALRRVAPAIETDASIYTSCVLIDFDYVDQHLIISSSNTLLDIKTLVPMTNLSGKHRLVLPHKRLDSILKELPPGMVSFETDGKYKLTVKSLASKRKFTMTSLDPSDFAASPRAPEAQPSVVILGKDFHSAASETSWCVEKSRVDGLMLIVKADGFQLFGLSTAMALASGPVVSASEPGDVVLPRVLVEAARALPEDGELRFLHDERKIWIESGATTIACGKLQHSFPKVLDHVLKSIPKEKRFRCSTEKFLSSVKAVSVAADVLEGYDKMVQIDIRYDQGICEVSTRRSEKNFGEDEFEVETGSVGSFKCSVNGGTLTSTLRSFAPTDADVYFDATEGQDTLYFQSEALLIAFRPIATVGAP